MVLESSTIRFVPILKTRGLVAWTGTSWALFKSVMESFLSVERDSRVSETCLEQVELSGFFGGRGIQRVNSRLFNLVFLVGGFPIRFLPLFANGFLPPPL